MRENNLPVLGEEDRTGVQGTNKPGETTFAATDSRALYFDTSALTPVVETRD
jgi:hypothetical protein